MESYNRQSYVDTICIHLCRCSIRPNVPTLHVDRMLDLCALWMQSIVVKCCARWWYLLASLF